MSIQNIILKLQEFWAQNGCYIASAYDLEVGAATMTPDTFFRVLGKKPWKTAYWQPSRRPGNSRYGENPSRVYKHNEFQVIIKPIPKNGQSLFLSSLQYLGVDIRSHDIRFIDRSWHTPSLGALGCGWRVQCDGWKIANFTYFQKAGGIHLNPNSLEITYNIEKLAIFLDNKNSYYDLHWNANVLYKELRLEEEKQFSKYNFENADIEFLRLIYYQYQQESQRLIQQELYYPAFDYVLKCSHVFNLLDARKAISVPERTTCLADLRKLSEKIAKLYLRKTEG